MKTKKIKGILALTGNEFTSELNATMDQVKDLNPNLTEEEVKTVFELSIIDTGIEDGEEPLTEEN